LIDEAFEKDQELSYEVYIDALDKLSRNMSNRRVKSVTGRKHAIDRFLQLRLALDV